MFHNGIPLKDSKTIYILHFADDDLALAQEIDSLEYEYINRKLMYLCGNVFIIGGGHDIEVMYRNRKVIHATLTMNFVKELWKLPYSYLHLGTKDL